MLRPPRRRRRPSATIFIPTSRSFIHPSRYRRLNSTHSLNTTLVCYQIQQPMYSLIPIQFHPSLLYSLITSLNPIGTQCILSPHPLATPSTLPCIFASIYYGFPSLRRLFHFWSRLFSFRRSILHLCNKMVGNLVSLYPSFPPPSSLFFNPFHTIS